MSVQQVGIRIFNRRDGWHLEVTIAGKKNRLNLHSTLHKRTASPYASCADAITSARHLVRELMPEAPAGVPGVPVDGWNRDGDVPSDKLTGGGQ